MGVGGAWSEWSEREYTCTLYVVQLYMYRKRACVGEESAGGKQTGGRFSCRFLFDNQSPAHIYYRWKLFSILQV